VTEERKRLFEKRHECLAHFLNERDHSLDGRFGGAVSAARKPSDPEFDVRREFIAPLVKECGRSAGVVETEQPQISPGIWLRTEKTT
jgi:hypothetical protein